MRICKNQFLSQMFLYFTVQCFSHFWSGSVAYHEEIVVIVLLSC